MSQRRGGTHKEPAIAVEEETIPFGESLELPAGGLTMERTPPEESTGASAPADAPISSGSLSLDARYESETQALKLKQWKEGHFAAGMTPGTWGEEYGKWRHNFREQCVDLSKDDGNPCGFCSAIVCGALGAGRVGNMAILRQSTEWVEEEEEDETGEVKPRRFTRPKLDLVAGPYWPMLCLVTYPLIFGVSIATLVSAIPGKPAIIIIFWAVCTLGLIYALAMTAFRDPGILPRHHDAPDSSWRWSDRAHSYRPRGAWFDPDTGVIVEGFDHTCPWTGTAIGAKNMGSFQCFVALVFICLILDIVLLTGGIP